VKEPIMTTQPSPAHEAVDYEKLLVHNWRVARLIRLGVPGPLAEVYADHLDWRQVARLVQLGCPPAAGPAHRPLMSGPVNWRDAVCRHADPDL
jgi:hypothetical protein